MVTGFFTGLIVLAVLFVFELAENITLAGIVLFGSFGAAIGWLLS